MRKSIWIIGCSSGIGLNLLELYLAEGHNVIASSRDIESKERIKELKDKYENLRLLNCDVSDTESVKDSIEQIFDSYKHLDLCIFNAGVYEAMTYKQWNIEHFENMANINYLGAVRVITSLVPYLEKQDRKAKCVFNASLSSYFGLPYGGAYSASKASLVNFAQSIQPELLEKNIEIQIINHGFVKTRLTAKNDFEMPELMEPEFAAKEIFKGIEDSYRFEIRFPFKLSLFLRLLNILPYKISMAINRRLLK